MKKNNKVRNIKILLTSLLCSLTFTFISTNVSATKKSSDSDIISNNTQEETFKTAANSIQKYVEEISKIYVNEKEITDENFQKYLEIIKEIDKIIVDNDIDIDVLNNPKNENLISAINNVKDSIDSITRKVRAAKKLKENFFNDNNIYKKGLDLKYLENLLKKLIKDNDGKEFIEKIKKEFEEIKKYYEEETKIHTLIYDYSDSKNQKQENKILTYEEEINDLEDKLNKEIDDPDYFVFDIPSEKLFFELDCLIQQKEIDYYKKNNDNKDDADTIISKTNKDIFGNLEKNVEKFVENFNSTIEKFVEKSTSESNEKIDNFLYDFKKEIVENLKDLYKDNFKKTKESLTFNKQEMIEFMQDLEEKFKKYNPIFEKFGKNLKSTSNEKIYSSSNNFKQEMAGKLKDLYKDFEKTKESLTFPNLNMLEKNAEKYTEECISKFKKFGENLKSKLDEETEKSLQNFFQEITKSLYEFNQETMKDLQELNEKKEEEQYEEEQNFKIENNINLENQNNENEKEKENLIEDVEEENNIIREDNKKHNIKEEEIKNILKNFDEILNGMENEKELKYKKTKQLLIGLNENLKKEKEKIDRDPEEYDVEIKKHFQKIEEKINSLNSRIEENKKIKKVKKVKKYDNKNKIENKEKEQNVINEKNENILNEILEDKEINMKKDLKKIEEKIREQKNTKAINEMKKILKNINDDMIKLKNNKDVDNENKKVWIEFYKEDFKNNIKTINNYPDEYGKIEDYNNIINEINNNLNILLNK